MKITLLKKYLLANILILIITAKNCGIYNLITAAKKVNSVTPFSTTTDLLSKNNGNYLTITGWIFFENEKNRKIQLLKINASPENSNNSLLNNELIRIEWNKQENKNESQIILRINEKNNANKVIKENIEFSVLNWIFMTLSFDLQNKKINLFFKAINPSTFVYNKTFENIDFAIGEIGQFLGINYGCYDNKVDECFIGEIQNFNYFLDYVSDSEYLAYIDNSSFSSYDFNFDIYKNTQETNFKSKSYPEKKFSIKGEKNFGIEGIDPIILKGGNTIEIADVDFFNSEKISESPSLYFVLKYKEPLPDLFPLLLQQDPNGNNQIEIFLKRNNNTRNMEIRLLGKTIFESSYFLIENEIQKFSVLFLRLRTILKIGLINSKGFEVSRENIFPPLENGAIKINTTEINFVGQFNIYQLNILNNATGLIYSKIINLKQNENCENKKCIIFAGFEKEKTKCIECDDSSVLVLKNSKCEAYCPFEEKNIENRCYNCIEEKCEELNQNYFVLEKTGPHQLRINADNNLVNLDKDFSNVFNVNIEGGVKSQDFDFIQKNFSQNNTAIYDFQFFNNNLDDKNLTFSLKPKLTLYDKNKNLYQKNLVFNTKRFNDTNLNENRANINSFNHKPMEDYEENENLKDLATATAILFFISMFFGVIGSIFKCPYLDSDWNNFYFQKCLQTFLMAQYLAFWTVYNFQPPPALRSFFHQFFKLTIGWHKVFENVTKNDFNNSQGFSQHYFFNQKPRFFENNIYTHFLTNFVFVILLQSFLVVVYLGVLIFNHYIKKKNLLVNHEPENPKVENKNSKIRKMKNSSEVIHNFFHFKLIITVFLMFIVECSVFIFYNFFNTNYDHGYFIFSLILAIFYLLIILLLLFLVFRATIKYTIPEKKENIYYWFIWEGVIRHSPSKFFQSLQYLFYFLFSFILVFSYESRNTQIIINFVFLILFLCYIIIYQPADEKFWKYEQIAIHGFVFITKILLFCLIVDYSVNNISSSNKKNLGITIAVFIFLIVVWNFLVLLIKLLQRIYMCYKAKKVQIQNDLLFHKHPEEGTVIDDDQRNLFDIHGDGKEYPKLGYHDNEELVNIVKPDQGEEDFFDKVVYEKNLEKKEKSEEENIDKYDEDLLNRKINPFFGDDDVILINNQESTYPEKNIVYHDTLSFGKNDNRIINTLLRKQKEIQGINKN